MSWPDEWGRWSESDRVLLAFARPFPQRARFVFQAGANEANLGQPIVVRAGDASGIIRLARSPWTPEQVQLDLVIDGEVSMLEIEVPQPTRLENGRLIGIGISRLRVLDLSHAESGEPPAMLEVSST